MSLVDGLLHRLRVLVRGNAYDDELRDEMQFHVELETQALSRQSATPHDDARRAFGNQTYYREEVRRMTALGWLDRMRQDLWYAWRGLRREPGFTAAVVVTLALGLGVNAAVYSVLDRVFVRPPAGVPDPDSVRRLYIDQGYSISLTGKRTMGASAFASFNYPNYHAIQQALPLTPIALYTPSDSVELRTGVNAGSARLSYANASYFAVLGLRPLEGRFFAPDEDHVESAAPVVVISDPLWDRLYQRSPSALGQRLSVSGRQFTVIGVASPDFTGLDLNRADLWTPLGNFVNKSNRRTPWYQGTGNYLRAFARVRNPNAEQLLDAKGGAALRAEKALLQGKPDTLTKMLMGPLVEAQGPAKPSKEATISTRIAGVALIVFLIACANVANLLLLRAARRQREIAIRRALGVSAGRLIGQLMTESVLLAVLAGAASLLLGDWGGLALRRLLFPRINWAGGVVTTHWITACAAGALLAGIVAGLAPAFGALSIDPVRGLRDGARAGHRGARGARSTLLIVQAALSVVLLVGAGLFVRSLQNLDAIDIGYAKDELLLVSPGFSDGARHDTVVAQTLPRLVEALARAPGVRSIALTDMLPMRGFRYAPTYLARQDSAFHVGQTYPTVTSVSPTYLATAGIAVLSGRGFRESDRRGSVPVAVVSQAFARAAWPGQSPIGKCLIVGETSEPCTTVVGVAADSHQWELVEDETFRYYLPLDQAKFTNPSAILIRGDPAHFGMIATEARRVIAKVLPSSDATYVSSMNAALEPQTRPWRLGAELFSALAALAVIIAAIGIYSVVAYGVSQRAHEIGVRIALGARSANIMELIVASGLRVVAVGIVIGIVSALLLARAIQSLLYGVGTYDPTVLLTAAALLTVLGALACLIPAWRASRVDPVVTLRAE